MYISVCIFKYLGKLINDDADIGMGFILTINISVSSKELSICVITTAAI